MDINVNGKKYRIETDSSRSLLSVLRDDLDLTGSKYGCGEGQCGSCTVLIDGYPTRACITQAADTQGRRVKTIEGLEKDGQLHPLQQAFLEVEAMQCAFCTPGMIMSAVALLRQNPSPTRQDIVSFMEGNICRCGTYPRIVTAILKASAMLREGSHD